MCVGCGEMVKVNDGWVAPDMQDIAMAVRYSIVEWLKARLDDESLPVVVVLALRDVIDAIEKGEYLK
jgi:hypothetical protein